MATRKIVAGVIFGLGVTFFAYSICSRLLVTELRDDLPANPAAHDVGHPLALVDRHVTPEPLQTYPVDSIRLDPSWEKRLLSDVVAASLSKNMGEPSVAVHALRLREHAARKKVDASDQLFFDDELKLLTDDRVFREFGSGLSVLVDTPFGAGYRTRSRASTESSGTVGAIADGGMTHVDIMLCVLGELGIGLDYPVVTTSDREMTLADVLEDSLQRFNFDRELEFSLVGYCCYLRQPSWTTKRGTAYSVDEIAQHLLERPEEIGVCCGTHRIYAIAKYCLWARRFPRFASPDIRKRCEDYLKDVSECLVDCQNQDGSWDGNWYVGLSQTAQFVNKDRIGQYADKIRVTGHMLEWFAIVPPELRPRDNSILLGVNYLRRELEVNRNQLYNSHLLPVTHAVRALLNLSGMEHES